VRDKLGRFARTGGNGPAIRLQTKGEKKSALAKSIAGEKSFVSDSRSKLKAAKVYVNAQNRASKLEKLDTDSTNYRAQQLRSKAQAIKRKFGIGR